MHINLRYLLFIIPMLFSIQFSAQTNKRAQLEARRIQLQKDQVYINALLSNTKRDEKNLLTDLKDLKSQIRIREELIAVISNESDELGNEIYKNQLEINKNERELKALKADYADMIFRSYKSKSQHSRIMFLLSSENFYQVYKRFQYMKQYSAFRKKQGEEIQVKTLTLQQLTDSLKVKKNQKEELLSKKKTEQSNIEKEKKEQENLLKQIKMKESKYKSQISQFQREEARINAQIDKIIRDAIAASNKKEGGAPSTGAATFTLTAEAKELAAKFTLNKGKLPWPLEKGFVSTYFGLQPHPIVKTATIQSHGVRITTEEGSKARAVFEGTVLSVQVLSGNKKAVLIQHGDYITVYKDLENVFVKTGDKVETKQEIGTVFTDKITGKTILGFLLSKNADTENPANWIYNM